MTLSLADIAKAIGANLQLKTEDCTIIGLAPLQIASNKQISFLSNPKYQVHLNSTHAAAVILSADMAANCPVNVLVMDNPYLGFAKAAALFDDTPKMPVGIHPSAVIDPTAKIDPTASIGPFVSIGKHVTIAAKVEIAAGCAISDEVSIDEDSSLKANVSIYHKVKIGKRCIIHSGAVIGSDGFGLANDSGRWVKIPQLGAVTIENDVEIGANTTIDRGALEDTLIKAGAKIDNQVQIAHNVVIGENTAIAAKAGIAGSSRIGRNCLIGGAAGINGHITIGDQVIITAMSGVSHNLPLPGIYSASMPARDVKDWNKTVARLNRLDKLMQKVKVLESKILGETDKQDE